MQLVDRRTEIIEGTMLYMVIQRTTRWLDVKMVFGCILVCCESGKSKSVAEEVKKIKGVKKVFATVGRWDVAARVYAPDLKALREIALKVHNTSGVRASETLVGL